jgi:hypothetical protein
LDFEQISDKKQAVQSIKTANFEPINEAFIFSTTKNVLRAYLTGCFTSTLLESS